MSKVVFVGNVPYNMGEEQLIDVFKSVGQVVGFRLVYDRETGKPKGYGFCEFTDHETALSAVRNLNTVDVGGRPLRIDIADSDPFLEGKTTTRGELLDGLESRYAKRDMDDGYRSIDNPKEFLNALPQGVALPPGASAMDAISQILATTAPAELTEVLAQMKAFVANHPDQARTLLQAHPQLAYALFQALLLNKIVDPAILQRMLAATTGGNQAPAYNQPPAPQASYPPPASSTPVPSYPPMYQQPPATYMQQPLQQPQPQHAPPQGIPGQPPYYRATPPQHVPQPAPTALQPPPAPAPTHTPAAPAIDNAQREMLMQVLALTPEQIAALPPAERDAIQNLKNQFMGALASQGAS